MCDAGVHLVTACGAKKHLSRKRTAFFFLLPSARRFSCSSGAISRAQMANEVHRERGVPIQVFQKKVICLRVDRTSRNTIYEQLRFDSFPKRTKRWLGLVVGHKRDREGERKHGRSMYTLQTALHFRHPFTSRLCLFGDTFADPFAQHAMPFSAA